VSHIEYLKAPSDSRVFHSDRHVDCFSHDNLLDSFAILGTTAGQAVRHVIGFARRCKVAFALRAASGVMNDSDAPVSQTASICIPLTKDVLADELVVSFFLMVLATIV
jgi:hypothetical protein